MKQKILIIDYKQRHSQVIIKDLQKSYDVYAIVKSELEGYFFSVKPIYNNKELNIELIVKICKNNDINVIVPISINDYDFFSKNRETLLNSNIKILIAPYDIWSMLNNKNQTMKFAKKIGVNIPKTVVLSQDNFINEINENLDYKVVIKSVNEGGSRFVRYASSDNESKEIIDNFSTQKKDIFDSGVIAQEYISGTSCAYFCIAKEGKIFDEFGHMRLRENPPTGGVSTSCKSYYHEKLFNYGRKIIEKSSYSGVCMVEFKYVEEKDEFYLIEVNPKFWGSILLPIVAGVNFPMSYMKLVNNETINKNEYVDIKVQFLISDFNRTIKYKIDIKEFLKDLLSKSTKKDVSYLGFWRYIKFNLGKKIYG